MNKKTTQNGLKYIGGGAFLPGVPARDLTDEEAKAYGGAKALTASGLYEAVKRHASNVKRRTSNKEGE